MNPWLFPQDSQECFIVDDRGAMSRVLLKEENLPGASIFFASCQQKEEIRLKETVETPMLALYFSLEGDTCSMENGAEDQRLKGQQHVLSYKPRFDGYYILNSPTVRNFGVVVDESFFGRLYMEEVDCLKRFWDNVHAGRIAEITPAPMSVTPRQLSLIHDIAYCPFSGQMREAFLESKIVELFLFQVAQAESLKGMSPVHLQKTDIDKLHAAKAFIREHMFEPLTLRQLCRESGLNEFKLKKGFRDLFGTTAFGYLNELRMSYARQLILNSDCSILEAAFSVGYGEPYSFTRAFRKHFGYLPSELKK